MRRFYATIQGNRGEASRMGSTESGIRGHIRGWNLGIEVMCFVKEDGEDCCEAMLTAGSNGRFPRKSLGRFTIKDLK